MTNLASVVFNKRFTNITSTDIIIIEGYIFENDIQVRDKDNYRYLNSEEFIQHMKNKEVNEITKFYINQCKKLKNYDLRDVRYNLKQLNLI